LNDREGGGRRPSNNVKRRNIAFMRRFPFFRGLPFPVA